MDFHNIKDAAMLVLMFVVFGAPALAIAARIAMKPVLEAITRLRENSGGGVLQTPEPRLAALEDEVGRLSAEVQRLSESEAFTRQLIQPAPGTSTTIHEGK